MEKKNLFSERLISLRKEKKLTQYSLAEQLEFSRGQIGNYEQGTREPDQLTLLKIANFFNVSVDYLIGKSNIKQSADSIIDSNPKETTVALHTDDYDELPQEAKDEINNFIEYVKQKYKKKCSLRTPHKIIKEVPTWKNP